ncbi:hypothetical protein EDD15DRAFT_2173236 [Pisolithus albus]|nr:hypothetical protein EDD15DRAFT_2174007 [Pisolithus albus]KAI5987665.1 hypothetical protein EDD15DRAFT_2173236 [Pisolithus albus]
MVGAFHGHAHNRFCQLDWHPMYIDGTGNTDGEGCEHVFSTSNELARSTRHATRFHRHQAIEQHFAFWNEDKYEALTRFIRNHYKEATLSVHRLTSELEILKGALHLTDDDFPRFLSEERAYLNTVHQSPPREQMTIRYVQVLDELEQRKTDWAKAREAANGALSGVAAGDFRAATVAINGARIQVELACAKLQHTEALAAHLRGCLGLESHWEIGSEDYNLYKEEATLGKYREALGELERLVVMRLFELAKVSMSGVGMIFPCCT